MNSFNKWVVVDNNFQKKLMFTRPEQVKWNDKVEDNKIKGTFKDTYLNQQLNRVGKETYKPVA